jgi:hypothetical protein
MATETQIRSAVSTVTANRDPSYRERGNNQGGIVRQYLDVTLANCGLEEWSQICKVAVDDAINGDVAARRYARDWLSRILIPAIERILVAQVNVNVDASDSQEQVKRLVSMLLGNDRRDDDVIDVEVVAPSQQ